MDVARVEAGIVEVPVDTELELLGERRAGAGQDENAYEDGPSLIAHFVVPP